MCLHKQKPYWIEIKIYIQHKLQKYINLQRNRKRKKKNYECRNNSYLCRDFAFPFLCLMAFFVTLPEWFCAGAWLLLLLLLLLLAVVGLLLLLLLLLVLLLVVVVVVVAAVEVAVMLTWPFEVEESLFASGWLGWLVSVIGLAASPGQIIITVITILPSSL